MSYEISDDKVQAIVSTDSGKRAGLTTGEVYEFCTADWPEGQEHQDWLDSATPEEIAGWVIAGRS